MAINHQEIIQLVIAYTLVGAFVFTVVITCLSLIGVVRFADSKQQNKLFVVLIVELVVIGMGTFSSFLKFDPGKVAAGIEATAIVETQENVSTLLNKIDKLSNSQLIMFENNPPVRSPEIDKVVNLRDPNGLRFDDPKVAKELLKMRVVLERRDLPTLKAWEIAINDNQPANK